MSNAALTPRSSALVSIPTRSELEALAPPAPPRSILRYTRQATPCPGGGKNSYRTKRKARRVAEGKRALFDLPLYVYRCHSCGLWHLSKEPQRIKGAR